MRILIHPIKSILRFGVVIYTLQDGTNKQDTTKIKSGTLPSTAFQGFILCISFIPHLSSPYPTYVVQRGGAAGGAKICYLNAFYPVFDKIFSVFHFITLLHFFPCIATYQKLLIVFYFSCLLFFTQLS